MKSDKITKIVLYPVSVTITETENGRTVQCAKPSIFEVEELIKKGFVYPSFVAAMDFLFNRKTKLKSQFPQARSFNNLYDNVWCNHCSKPIAKHEAIRSIKDGAKWHEDCWQNQ